MVHGIRPSILSTVVVLWPRSKSCILACGDSGESYPSLYESLKKRILDKDGADSSEARSRYPCSVRCKVTRACAVKLPYTEMQAAASSYNAAAHQLEWYKNDGGMKVRGLVRQAAVEGKKNSFINKALWEVIEIWSKSSCSSVYRSRSTSQTRCALLCIRHIW
jgi:hypothetical protein